MLNFAIFFDMMFTGCKSLKNKYILENWKFGRSTHFESMFREPDDDVEWNASA